MSIPAWLLSRPKCLPVFQSFGCSVRRLERIIAKALGCSSIRIQGLLGMGSCNIVLDVLVLGNGQASKGDGKELSAPNQNCVAIRIPLTHAHRSVSVQQAIAGYAATLFVSSLGLPAAVAGPVYLADVPYAPRGRGYLTVMPVLTTWLWWNFATPAAKRAFVVDLAAVVVQLYRHPLQGFGDMALTSGGIPCVGPLHRGAVALAIERGVDVGGLSPGPYPTWKEFAWSQIQGVLLLYGDDRWHGEQIKAECKRVLEWLDKFKPPNEKLYMVHPDLNNQHVIVDPYSGHLRSIIDWDFARAGTVQFLAASFFLPFIRLSDDFMDEEDKAEEEELRAVYSEELRLAGAPELVQYVFRGWRRKDPQFMFEKALCPAVNLFKQTARGAYLSLRKFCTGMGFPGDGDRLVIGVLPPWKRSRPNVGSPAAVSEVDSSVVVQVEEMKKQIGMDSSSSDDDHFTSSSSSSSF